MAPKRRKSASNGGGTVTAGGDDGSAKKAAKPSPTTTQQTSDGKVPRGDTPRALTPEGRSFKALSWNVNGLRALLEKQPEQLTRLIEQEAPDYLCLQEHKLQEGHVEGVKAKLEELLPGYVSYWSASTVKKGYSGVAVFVRTPPPSAQAAASKKQKTIKSFFKKPSTAEGDKLPEDAKPAASSAEGVAGTGDGLPILAVTYDMEAHKGEGRIITVEYEHFFVVAAYVPNSGMKLERLAYRTEQWDKDLRIYLSSLATRKPTLLTGDLNVAHLDIDIYNVQSKHVAKSAGTTPQERASFGMLLGEGWVDAFRHMHPSAKGCYTYWSVRAGNRATNRGLRLDYCVVSEGLAKEGGEGLRLHDCWILDEATLGASDHCPVGVILSGVV